MISLGRHQQKRKNSGGLAVKRIIKILPTESELYEIIGITYDQIGTVLRVIGDIRTENPDSQQYVAIIHGGIANLNPSLFVITAITDRICLTTYAI